MQTVAQWTSGNGITYYIPRVFRYVFRYVGVVGGDLSNHWRFIWHRQAHLHYGLHLGLVDVFGRRLCLLTGLLQCITHIFMAVYMSI